ncbi:MAG TPA: hypothetical protein VJ998_04905 [Pseudomonadales bacterium]|nr:hypothetical protein [Pseudomonadales bacterium]
MADDIISSDAPLSASQQEIFRAILDTLVPAGNDGILPSAAELDLAGFSEAPVAGMAAPRLLDIVGCFDAGFPALAPEERHALVEEFRGREPALFQSLLLQTYALYYQDDRVLVGIGSKAGPPFPEGNSIVSGDLSLLDPVQTLNKGYRRTGD